MRTLTFVSPMAHACAVSFNAAAEKLHVATARGEKVEIPVDFPAGPGPFPTLVLAPGQGYPVTLPILEQTAKRLVPEGIAVYRFNWARSSTAPGTSASSAGRVNEPQDRHAVLAAAEAEPRVDHDRLFVKGKARGSIVTWRALAADKSLKAGLFVTAVCSRMQKGQVAPTYLGDKTTPARPAKPGRRCSFPVTMIHSVRPARSIALQSFQAVPLVSPLPEATTATKTLRSAAKRPSGLAKRNIESVAQLAANFLADVADRQQRPVRLAG